MRLTEEQVFHDNKHFESLNAFAELKYCGWEIPQRKSITNADIHFYAWLCRSAIALLKEQGEKDEKIITALDGYRMCDEISKNAYDNLTRLIKSEQGESE